MKLAYLISAYKDPQQLKRLVNRLHDNDTFFFIHVDMNTDIATFCKALEGIKNVSFTNTRFNVSWGGMDTNSISERVIESCSFCQYRFQ